jgi:C-terminal processing protease CtpA/Prc
VQREGQPLTVEVERSHAEVPPTWEREPIEELPGGVWFVDLAEAEWVEIFKKLDVIAKAPGVVFDLRGYPNGTHPVLRHLMTEPEQDEWMSVAQIVYPDHQRIAGWKAEGWDLSPAPPHIEGKVAFITGGGAISYAESVMGYVEGRKLGEIVGGPTAGANGNVNPFTTPGGYVIYSTGMRVLKHDGSQHHTIGVQPTVPAEPTLAGVPPASSNAVRRSRRSSTRSSSTVAPARAATSISRKPSTDSSSALTASVVMTVRPSRI